MATKRLGKYHNVSRNNNSDNDSSSLRSHLSELTSICKDNSKKPSLDWDKPIFGHKSNSLQTLLENANKTTEKATKFLVKMKSKQLACVNRAKSVPENATIRKEYINCGKEICDIEHGPYYYAYWKDAESKKLKKKYIGDHMPKNKELDNDYDDRNYTL